MCHHDSYFLTEVSHIPGNSQFLLSLVEGEVSVSCANIKAGKQLHLTTARSWLVSGFHPVSTDMAI